MNGEVFFAFTLGIVIGWVLAHIDFIDNDGEGW